MTRCYGFARWLWCSSATVVLLCAAHAPAQVIGASGNNNEPPTITAHNFANGAFHIDEAVALDNGSGPWTKELIGNGAPSGQPFQITETLLNAGGVPWTDWHERIITRTTINASDDAPGFLFRDNSLSLMADYGSGFVGLVEGVDYSVVAPPYAGPGAGANNGLEAIDIFFEPHAVIQPGDTLKIEKEIFEVFLDENVWLPGEIAEILEYPTPEPVSAALLAVGAMCVVTRRRASV